MYKAKQKTVSLVVACLAFFVTIVMAFACLFSAPTINVASAATTTVTDKLTVSMTDATSTTYVTWKDKDGGDSAAVYAGNSSKSSNGGIQLRSSNSNSGIVTTTSGGNRVAKIIVAWDSATSSGRTLDIYGKNTAYTQATELYDSATQGTKLGSITCGTSTELSITGDYKFVGL